MGAVAQVMRTARASYYNAVEDFHKMKMKMNFVEKEWLRLLVITTNGMCGLR